MWLLILSIVYHSPQGDRVKVERIEGFQTEKACIQYMGQEDRWLKKIKSKTNIKEWQYSCVRSNS